ncbi:MAG: YggT family protein [Synechococcus sp. SB0668_bin_15]|nr:YggT family protein [Synechococcus sp. SB0668_bin_15]MXZ82374.1 YggT family protein [Synechococcus sp. SB0666_bin_14]MYA90900.1 YggT family protein [Synechococcus sp. SB0663_bin_10]MYC49469.1 YggT family protein [Synechococcus sp. SB0662_bin_14]MYG46925.1 YggT family protein [Synechococcus sp. SB0675_bin_6]MYJ60106.1 YggT family protein [Synechococcus sp. SB0672_bin_6]MYK91980.1 YggT family protein [Synechococcus sp. SB0669_bin_8]
MLVAAFLIEVVLETLSIFSLLLLLRVLLSWFPNLPWENPLLAALASVTDPYLNLFRGLIPPIGGLDLSAILAFLALTLTSALLRGITVPLLANASYTRYVVG